AGLVNAVAYDERAARVCGIHSLLDIGGGGGPRKVGGRGTAAVGGNVMHRLLQHGNGYSCGDAAGVVAVERGEGDRIISSRRPTVRDKQTVAHDCAITEIPAVGGGMTGDLPGKIHDE